MKRKVLKGKEALGESLLKKEVMGVLKCKLKFGKISYIAKRKGEVPCIERKRGICGVCYLY